MSEVVVKVGVKREVGFLYFIDKQGHIARALLARKGVPTDRKQEVVAKVGIKREPGFLYFISSSGDICRSVMRGKKGSVVGKN